MQVLVSVNCRLSCCSLFLLRSTSIHDPHVIYFLDHSCTTGRPNVLQIYYQKIDLRSQNMHRFTVPLLRQQPQETAKMCAGMYPLVLPWMVAEGLNIDFSPIFHPAPPLSTDQSSPPSHAPETYLYYLSYLSALLDKHIECRQNRQLVSEFFHLALWIGRPPPSTLFEPRPSSEVPSNSIRWWWKQQLPVVPKIHAHNVQWRNHQQLRSIIDNPSSYAYSDTELADACARYGFFRGLLSMYLRSSSPHVIKAALALCVLLQDYSSLATIIDTQMNISSASSQHVQEILECWDTLWDCVHAFYLSSSLSSPAISIQFVTSYMAACLGPSQTISRMIRSPALLQLLARERLSPSFYENLLLVSQLRLKQRDLVT